MRRARGGTSGRLQDQRITLTCVDTGERLGGTRTETLDAIRGRLGLKFDQFCRSALLAQGEFAAFLRADAADRADLLERMTGTEIYGELSMRAYRRAADLVAALRERSAAVAGITVLADDERAAVVAARGQAEGALVAARARRDALAARAAWTAQRVERVRAVTSAEADRDAAARDWLAAADQRDRIERGRRAEAVRPAWDDRSRAIVALTEARKAVTLAAAAIESTGAVRDRAIAARGAIEEVVARARAVRVAAGLAPVEPAATAGVVPDRVKLDRMLDELATSLATADERRRVAAEAIGEAKAAVQQAESQARKFEQQGKKAPVDVARRVYDLAERAMNAARDLVELVAAARAAAVAEAAAIEARTTHVAAIETHQDVAAKAEAAAAADRLRRDEAQAALDRLVAATTLAHHRSQLVDGEACPLCGAIEHPWAGRGAVDQLIEDDRARLGALRATIEAAVGVAAAARKAIEGAELAIAGLDATRAAAAARRTTAVTEFRAALAAIGELPWATDPSDAAAERVAADRAAVALKAFDKAKQARAIAETADRAATDARTVVIGKQADLDHAKDRARAIDVDAVKVAAAIRKLEAELLAARAAAEATVQTRERAIAAAEAEAKVAHDAVVRRRGSARARGGRRGRRAARRRARRARGRRGDGAPGRLGRRCPAGDRDDHAAPGPRRDHRRRADRVARRARRREAAAAG